MREPAQQNGQCKRSKARSADDQGDRRDAEQRSCTGYKKRTSEEEPEQRKRRDRQIERQRQQADIAALDRLPNQPRDQSHYQAKMPVFPALPLSFRPPSRSGKLAHYDR